MCSKAREEGAREEGALEERALEERALEGGVRERGARVCGFRDGRVGDAQRTVNTDGCFLQQLRTRTRLSARDGDSLAQRHENFRPRRERRESASRDRS